jgi:hypothetical protein
MGEKRNVYRLLVGKPEGEDTIMIDLVEMGRSAVDSIVVAQDRDKWRALVNTEVNLKVP